MTGNTENKRGADRLVGVVIASLGGAVLLGALQMPTFSERSISPWTVPGIFPAFVGAILCLLGFALAIRKKPPKTAGDPSPSPNFKGLFGMLTLGLSYIVLVGVLPFIPLTVAFMAGFVLIFRPPVLDRGNKPLAWLGIAAFVALIGIGIPMLFETVFLVTLP